MDYVTDNSDSLSSSIDHSVPSALGCSSPPWPTCPHQSNFGVNIQVWCALLRARNNWYPRILSPNFHQVAFNPSYAKEFSLYYRFYIVLSFSQWTTQRYLFCLHLPIFSQNPAPYASLQTPSESLCVLLWLTRYWVKSSSALVIRALVSVLDIATFSVAFSWSLPWKLSSYFPALVWLIRTSLGFLLNLATEASVNLIICSPIYPLLNMNQFTSLYL